MMCPPLPAPLGAARLRVLVVEDEPSIARFMVRVLNAEWEACAVPDGRDALLRLASGYPYDVILLDMGLPGIGGIEVYNRLLDHAPALAERVVMVTGGSACPADQAFLDAFPHEVLDKPFTLEALREVVGRVAERLRRWPVTLPPKAA